MAAIGTDIPALELLVPRPILNFGKRSFNEISKETQKTIDFSQKLDGGSSSSGNAK